MKKIRPSRRIFLWLNQEWGAFLAITISSSISRSVKGERQSS